LGLAACQKGLAVGFTTAAALVHELIEARDEKRLLRLQRQLAACKLLIIDELGYVPLSPTGAELLFEVFSRRYERGSVIVTSNLPFDEWTSVFGSERLTGALFDRLTHHVHIPEMNGDSYRLRQSKHRRRSPSSDASQRRTSRPKGGAVCLLDVPPELRLRASSLDLPGKVCATMVARGQPQDPARRRGRAAVGSRACRRGGAARREAGREGCWGRGCSAPP
jgi:hypothetical protein